MLSELIVCMYLGMFAQCDCKSGPVSIEKSTKTSESWIHLLT